jgi:uncharacterized protein (TIGR02246 family)
MNTEDLVAIEYSLWKNNPDIYGSIYLPDAVLIFPDVGRIGRDAAVEAIRRENSEGRVWAEVHFDELKETRLSPDTVLLTYRATARWNYEEKPSKTLCGTLYVRRDGEWRVAFHQQTVL